jgi:hypothetical protein
MAVVCRLWTVDDFLQSAVDRGLSAVDKYQIAVVCRLWTVDDFSQSAVVC